MLLHTLMAGISKENIEADNIIPEAIELIESSAFFFIFLKSNIKEAPILVNKKHIIPAIKTLIISGKL